MKQRSVFEIIGPVMVGPSSSHTAGALRIAQIAGHIVKESVIEVKFILHGSFAKTYKGHGTDRALLAGIMGLSTENPDVRDAFHLAEKRGLSYSFQTAPLTEGMHPNTVSLELVSKKGKKLTLVGSSIGGGEVIIKAINGISVSFTGEYPTLIVQQIDRPGVAAHITSILAKNNVNIVTISMYREHRGTRAFTILETDENLATQVVEQVKDNPHIYDVFLVTI